MVMNDKNGVKVTVTLHYPIVKMLMELTHSDTIDGIVNYIDMAFRQASDTKIHGAYIRGAGRLQECHTEIFDDSDFHFEDDWIFDEEE